MEVNLIEVWNLMCCWWLFCECCGHFSEVQIHFPHAQTLSKKNVGDGDEDGDGDGDDGDDGDDDDDDDGDEDVDGGSGIFES